LFELGLKDTQRKFCNYYNLTKITGTLHKDLSIFTTIWIWIIL